jgi:surface carbohydrate biosynthesis protein
LNRVALLVDHPQRDLAGLVLLAARLGSRGVTSFLVPSRLAGRELACLAPDVAVLNHLRDFDVSLVRLLTDLGSRIAVLDTEGGVLASFDAYDRGLADDQTRRAVDRYFSWGPKLAEHVLGNGWLNGAQVAVTGHPRFDLYQDPWRRTVGTWAGTTTARERPILLVVGSFNLANPRFLSVEQEVELLVSRAQQDRGAVERRLEVERAALSSLVVLTNALADALPSARVVYRPHPFECVETYSSLLSERVELCRSGSAIEWILQADALIQRGSTLAVEGAMAGIPVFSPEWLPDWSRVEWVRSLSTPCSDLDELVAGLRCAIERRGQAQEISAEGEALIRDWFFDCDGGANERVADGLCEIAANGSRVDRRRARAIVAGARAPSRSLAKQVVGWMRFAFSLPVDFSFSRLRRLDAPWQWDDGSRTFTVDQVTSMVGAFSSCGIDSALPVGVEACRDRADYVVPNRMGRSIAVFPRADSSK